MKLIPLFKCRNMQSALSFYTEILDFKLKYDDVSPDDWVVDLVNGEAELQLTFLEQDTVRGTVANVRVEDVDALFEKYVERGLDVSGLGGVHGGPLDQSWGMREFYVTDADGNTLRFGMEISDQEPE